MVFRLTTNPHRNSLVALTFKNNIMETKTLNATLVSNGKKVIVYKSKLRNTYIDYSDCKTEYQYNELKF